MSGWCLADGTKIGGGPVASVVAGASDLVVGVCTAGSEISSRITEHQRNGQRLRAMFLDDLGSWAVDQVRQQVCRTIEAEATGRGWRASASLSPGESEWSVAEQSVIFSLVGHTPDWGRFERVHGDVAHQVAVADRGHRPRPAGGRGRQQLRFLHDPRAVRASPSARSLVSIGSISAVSGRREVRQEPC